MSHLPQAAAPDALIWKMLFDRQTALLHRRAAPAFGEGLRRLGLRRDAVPSLPALSALVRDLSGWELKPFGQAVDPDTFLGLLARRQFPVVTRLRTMREFDFSPQPDFFHDVFGHVPLLLDPAFADFLHRLGRAAVGPPPAAAFTRRQLWALYFFTAEFGLVKHDGSLRLYGAGLLSSAGEIHHCVADDTLREDFALATVLQTPVRDARFQEQYFVLPDWAELAACVGELSTLAEVREALVE